MERSNGRMNAKIVVRVHEGEPSPPIGTPVPLRFGALRINQRTVLT
jgi:hypothetical protein